MKRTLKLFLRVTLQLCNSKAPSVGARQSSWNFGILLLWLSLVCASGFAQEAKGSATLRGQVTDPTGAVVVGAEISVTAPDGVVRNTLSDAQGKYVVHGLQEGSVTLRATAAGFAAY